MIGAADRKGRVTEIIAREAAQFITREAGSGSLITVIRAQSIARGDRVLVFITVFPEDKTQAALNFLERHRQDFSDHLKQHTRLRPLPRIEFMLDNREVTGAPEPTPIAEVPEN
jgi:ribosome-binding factor A